uniref:Uncharacterized protein n=1 Tax=Kalanchoe fedtschenkoi TaxID=63787 RepID=A0A7N0VI79_KALFE
MGPTTGGDAAEKKDKLYDDDDDDDEEEEAASLCELPVHNEVGEMGESAASDDPESAMLRPQQPADVFEFFSGNNTLHSEMCPADDIIVSGKLLPIKDQCLRRSPHQTGDSSNAGGAETRQRQDARCRSSESLSKLKSTSQSNTTKARVVRSSCSLDDRRHGRRSHSSFVPELDRNCSGLSDTSAFSSPKVQTSRWQLLIFGMGMVKFPNEMELRDIKNRQCRRSNPAALFPTAPEWEAKCPTSGSNGRRGSSWGLLKALSCKDHTSISVTTSFVCMPHI